MTTQFACQVFATSTEFFASKYAVDFDVLEDVAFVESLLDQASDVLSLISGGRIHGICQTTVRPFIPDRAPWTYAIDPQAWTTPLTVMSLGPDDTDWHSGFSTVPLRGPNTDVVQVIVDGVILNPSEYGLLDNSKLFRKVGTWPSTNDMAKTLSKVGTWAIVYRFGASPDYITKQATLELAAELGFPERGRQSHLPPGVTSTSIQGVSLSLRDRADALREADEQLPAVLRFLGVYCPTGIRAPSGVWSPELTHGYKLIQDEGPSGS